MSAPATGSALLSSATSTPQMHTIAGLEEASSQSHASSSKHIGNATASGQGRIQYQPLAMADVLSRAGNDETRALDELLAERNTFCLEASKLSTENTRLWNIMRRVRKENDDLKSTRASSPSSGTAHSANVLTSTPSNFAGASSTPLLFVGSAAEISAFPAKTHANRVSVPRASSSPLSGDMGATAATDDSDALRGSSSTSEAHAPPSSASSVPLAPATLLSAAAAAAAAAAEAAPSSASAQKLSHFANEGPSSLRQDEEVASSTGSNADFAHLASTTSPQYQSIMQQRAAAAQAQHQRAQQLANEGKRSHQRTRSHELEAVDRSSMNSGSVRGDAPASPSHSASARASRTSLGLSGSLKSARPASHDSAQSVFSPRLDTSMMPFVTVTVASSNIRPSGGRSTELHTVFIHVSVRPTSGRYMQQSTWQIEKMNSDVVTLDARLRQKNSRNKQYLARMLEEAPLPDRSLFRDHAPSKVDLRKAMLQKYLRRVIEAPLPDKEDLCTFLCTDATPITAQNPNSLSREGFLTKKGQNFGRWVARWYALTDDKLSYYEWHGGPILGSISIRGAQIGRQQRNAAADADENSYRHAFLILETRLPANQSEPRQVIRHVLCAEDDEDRDEWVEVLVRVIEHLNFIQSASQEPGIKQPQTASEDLQPSASDVGESLGGMSVSSPVKARPSTGSSAEQAIGDAYTSVSPNAGAPMTPQQHSKSRHAEPATGSPVQPLTNRPKRAKKPAPLQLDPSTDQGAEKSDGLDDGSLSRNDMSSPAQSGPVLHESSDHLSSSRSANVISSPTDLSTHAAPGGSSAAAAVQGSSMSPLFSHMNQLQQQQQHGPPPRFLPRSTSQEMTRSSMQSRRSQDAGMVHTPSPDGLANGVREQRARLPISKPMNGTPIPTGYKFGNTRDDTSNSNNSSSNNGGGIGSSSGPPPHAPEGKKRFWHRFGGGGNNNDKHAAQPKKVFGVPLADSIAVSSVAEGLELPSVVYRCIEFLEHRNAAQEEGIYRLSGSSAVIKTLKERFNASGDANLLAPTEPFYDPHAIAGLLKQYLRELPSSVLTPELHLEFMRANDIVDRRERVNELGSLVSMLPLPNYSLLRTLCSHLIKVIERADVNKMTMRNVGIVFSPTLGIPAGVFALFLTEFDWVFYTDAQGEPAPRAIDEDILPPDQDELGATWTEQQQRMAQASSAADPAAPSDSPLPASAISPRTTSAHARNNRNSLRYNEAEADRLLGGPQGRNRLSAQHEKTDEADFAMPDDEPTEEEEEEEEEKEEGGEGEEATADPLDEGEPASNQAVDRIGNDDPREFQAPQADFAPPLLQQAHQQGSPLLASPAPLFHSMGSSTSSSSMRYQNLEAPVKSPPPTAAYMSSPRRRPMETEITMSASYPSPDRPSQATRAARR